MEKNLTLDIKNATLRLPSSFMNKFKRNKQHQKVKAKLVYNIDKSTENSLVVFIEEPVQISISNKNGK